MSAARAGHDDLVTDTVLVRVGTSEDDAELSALDRTAWSPVSGFPSTVSTGDPRPFFSEVNPPTAHLVAELDGRVVGYLRFRPPTDLPENAHVLAVNGLAVAEDARGRGVATALLQELVRVAEERGLRKLTLRVLSTNQPARRLYQKQGYAVEGTLLGEFVVDGALVDDLILARHLGDAPDPTG